MSAAPEVIAAADAYLARGYAIVAVRGKNPGLVEGENWRRRWPAEEIISRLARPGVTGIGFLGGTFNNGLVPLDFDEYDTPACETWWQTECEKAGIDPDDFPTVITPGKVRAGQPRRAGKHRYVQDWKGALTNREGKLAGLGVQVRGKGQCVLPPSPHPDGGRYAWAPRLSLADFEVVPGCPDFIYAAIEAAEQPSRTPPKLNGSAKTDKTTLSYCLAALDGERHRLSAVAEGARGSSLLAAARALGMLAHYGAYGEDVAREALLAACQANRLIAKDGVKGCEKAFASGWKYGADRPREIPVIDTLMPIRGAKNDGGKGAADEQQPADQLLILNPADPLPSARLFVDRHYTRDKLRTLHHHAGQFYAWSGTRYEIADPQAIRGGLYAFLEGAQVAGGKKGAAMPFRPTASKVNNVIDAVRAIINIASTINPPAWLAYTPACCPPPAEILPCTNGLVHLPTGEMQPPTPAFFSLNSLDFAYEPSAAAPSAWLKFLADLWPADAEAITTLQDLLGYFLTGDTRQQKIALLVGPKRSGKGTIARITTALLGHGNVCGPTLAGLGQNFGLAPLIGKQLAIIADARLGSRADQQTIAERLLSISGEDCLTVDRKFLEPWTGRLPTRFMLLTNELPRILDSSGALASRFIVLSLQTSFFGREDHGLTDRLLGELPAILNWAIAGWRRLQERGYLIQPASSAEAIRDLEDLGSPIGTFVRERCDVDPTRQVECATLFDKWKDWCTANNREHPGTVQSFGRDLRAAVPGLRIMNLRDGSSRDRYYGGISPKTLW